MSTFAPVVMAGNNPNLPDDTKSRCIRVLLLPDLEGTAEESDGEMIEDDARKIGDQLAFWADSVRDQVRTNRPPLPDVVKGRARERWSPLKRVAAAAGGRWPDVVDELAVRDVQRIESEREEGITQQRPHVVLLKNISDVWGGGEGFVATDDLLARLVARFPRMWGGASTFGKELTAQRLGRMLVQNYNIHSTRLPDGDRARGDAMASFTPAFRGLGVPLPEKPDGLDEPAESDGFKNCSVCGKEMYAPASINRGHCERCELTVKAAAS